jgi:hypothetical protein
MERGRREIREGRNMRKREEGRGDRAKEVGNGRSRGSLPPTTAGTQKRVQLYYTQKLQFSLGDRNRTTSLEKRFEKVLDTCIRISA